MTKTRAERTVAKERKYFEDLKEENKLKGVTKTRPKTRTRAGRINAALVNGFDWTAQEEKKLAKIKDQSKDLNHLKCFKSVQLIDYTKVIYFFG